MTFITPSYPKDAYAMASNWSRAHDKPAFAVCIELAETRLYHCKNCGDLGVLYMKLPSHGPFQSPAAAGVSTWYDGGEAYGKGWYVIDQVQAFPCPMCSGRRGKP